MLARLPVLPTPFERLFAAEYPRVVAIARRILGERGEAEDVAQEVFARFVAQGVAISAAAPGWLQLTAVRRALNSVRSRKRRIEREHDFADRGRPLLLAAQRDADPSVAILRGESAAAVSAAVRRLRDRDTTILALRYGGGLSYTELAHTLNVPVAHIGTLLARAERALRLEMTRATPR